jgi:hypothetical protein
MAIRAFAMSPAFCLELAVVAIPQQRVVVRIRFDENIPAIAAVATRRAAARDVLLPPKRDTTVAAIPSLYRYFCFIRKHVSPASRTLKEPT